MKGLILMSQAAQFLTRRGVLSAIPGLGIAAAIPTALVAMPRPDAELLALGEKLRAATADQHAVFARWASVLGDEGDDECAEATQRLDDVVREIASVKARTVEGLVVKAQAVEAYWESDWDFAFSENADEQAMQSLARDLLSPDFRAVA